MTETAKFKVHCYEELGDHAYWEFDFASMRAVLWSQGADDWEPESEYALRREGDKWQYLESQTQWEDRVAAIEDHVRRLHAFPTNSAPEAIRDYHLADVADAEANLRAAKARGAGWADFSLAIAKELEAQWQLAQA